jgi:hypothetical protein
LSGVSLARLRIDNADDSIRLNLSAIRAQGAKDQICILHPTHLHDYEIQMRQLSGCQFA